MQTMCILRLVDKDRQILGWNRVPAETRGDGGLWAMQDFTCEIETTGKASAVIFHWPDVHVYTTRTLGGEFDVTQGQVYTVPLREDKQPMLRFESEYAPLPAITVKQSVVASVGMARS